MAAETVGLDPLSWFLLAVVVLLVLVLALVYQRLTMQFSKARFALTALSTACFVGCAGLSAAAGGAGALLASAAAAALGYDALSDNLVFPSSGAGSLVILSATVGLAWLILNFSGRVLREWEGPARVSEVELGREMRQNELIDLARYDAWLILTNRGRDPLASTQVVDWKTDRRDPPTRKDDPEFLRELFVAWLSEAQIEDSGWRSASRAWVGHVWLNSSDQADDLMLLVFNAAPEPHDLAMRLRDSKRLLRRDASTQIFAVYPSTPGEAPRREEHHLDGVSLELINSRFLLEEALELKRYARDLVQRFRSEKAGLTDATLAENYVDLDVAPGSASRELSEDDAERPEARMTVSELLGTLQDGAHQRHLALTGEYGQGKSTAMLKFCHDWAVRYLAGDAGAEKVPLLIELRGAHPYGSDPEAFLGGWGGRYHMTGGALFNLVQSGDAIMIFEGFDELRNAGRAYDRHYHFEALWRFAYLGTRLVFTGRPNFFIDERESNHTLRSAGQAPVSGLAYTEHYRLLMLDADPSAERGLAAACRGYPETVRDGILAAAAEDPVFQEICTRPSMLPVVASIWDDIAKERADDQPLTGAALLETYLGAVFDRKAAELERERAKRHGSVAASYLILPGPIRELLTIAIACRICALGKRNTINNSDLTALMRDLEPMLRELRSAKDVAPDVQQGLARFFEATSGDDIADRIDKLVTEIRSASVLIPDPASGERALRFPHKQFYEYQIAKYLAFTVNYPRASVLSILRAASREKPAYKLLEVEAASIRFCPALISSKSPFVLNGILSRLNCFVVFQFLLIIDICDIVLFQWILSTPSAFGEKDGAKNEGNLENARMIFRGGVGAYIAGVFSSVMLYIFCESLEKFWEFSFYNDFLSGMFFLQSVVFILIIAAFFLNISDNPASVLNFIRFYISTIERSGVLCVRGVRKSVDIDTTIFKAILYNDLKHMAEFDPRAVGRPFTPRPAEKLVLPLSDP